MAALLLVIFSSATGSSSALRFCNVSSTASSISSSASNASAAAISSAPPPCLNSDGVCRSRQNSSRKRRAGGTGGGSVSAPDERTLRPRSALFLRSHMRKAWAITSRAWAESELPPRMCPWRIRSARHRFEQEFVGCLGILVPAMREGPQRRLDRVPARKARGGDRGDRGRRPRVGSAGGKASGASALSHQVHQHHHAPAPAAHPSASSPAVRIAGGPSPAGCNFLCTWGINRHPH